MIEITVFECESCSSRFDTEKDIHECTECGGEICDVCQAEDDLCDDCSDKLDAIDAAMHDTTENDNEQLEPATERTFMEDFLDHSEPGE